MNTPYLMLECYKTAQNYGGPQLSRQKQKSRVKSKSLASKAKVSRQKQKSRVKSKSLASKAKVSRQKQNARRKSKTLAAKAKRSPQKQNSRVKSKTLVSKVRKHSEANASLFILFPFIYGGRIYLSIFDIFI